MTGDGLAPDAIDAASTLLFVPGNRPERFEKALASGADLVIIDLEDAVAAGDKPAARTAVVDALSQRPASFCVRLNAAGTADHADDIAALSPVAGSIVAVVLAKTERPDQVDGVHAALGRPVVALIESARGVAGVQEIAQAAGTVRLAFGALDYSADVGSGLQTDVLAYPRSAIAVASRSAGLPGPIDTPSPRWGDPEALSEETLEARRFGMTGKLCIHPAQVGPVAGAFRPTEQEIAWARTVLAAAGAGSAAAVDGEMVDRPVYLRAARILDRAKESA